MIRDFRTTDIDRVMHLWLSTNILAHNFIDSEYWQNNFESVKEMMPKASIYVYEQNGEIQAFIGLMKSFIAGIFVSSDFQSKGIGKLLLDYSKGKHNELSLCVYKKNDRALRFYLKEGFTASAEQVDENTGEIEFVMRWKNSV
ncbi:MULTISPECIES: N-acetyltransferase [Clostridium]|uniref:N-acetyltransferase YjaB n=2 Tax=Clostridium TaxID=1485 RepID=D8GQX5_CLOLD|nr:MULTISPECIES: N-acetyltransferase [Clostridium]ADK16280.1 predicted acetyltransferase [Clostridium ljungdahlii DSM 13528]AGY75388.1 N-acetyltransferase [Clostridium autoethanogenum DSM 10061]ALU35554.1 Acetyltransferase [Clostridium autoethanogenum DSM 10061]OAA89848.1 putative N-acetyltransferase YjaB [Clostridium ljungdahlii DSM 13528]OVY52384.1 putative N-acetyltransferase YjaB [Clostridium autoethanogenum]